ECTGGFQDGLQVVGRIGKVDNHSVVRAAVHGEHCGYALRILELVRCRDGAAGIGCYGRDVRRALERHHTGHQAASATTGYVNPLRIDVVVLHGTRHDLVGVL